VLELGQAVADLLLVALAHGGERSQPEHLAEHGGVLQQQLVLRRQGVQARGDQGLDRVGQRQVGRGGQAGRARSAFPGR
jgi:hypothetical protein